MDSDDYIPRDVCERLTPYTFDKYDILSCYSIKVQNDTMKPMKKRYLLNNGEILGGVEYLNNMLALCAMGCYVWTNVYRREFLIANGLFFKNGILFEDNEFTPRVFLAAKTVVEIHAIIYYYVVREGSITMQKDTRKAARDTLATCREQEAIFQNIDYSLLRANLLDNLVDTYVTLFQRGNLEKYGNEYLPRKYLLAHAYRLRTKLKVYLLCFSPKLYSLIHNLYASAKRLKGS